MTPSKDTVGDLKRYLSKAAGLAVELQKLLGPLSSLDGPVLDSDMLTLPGFPAFHYGRDASLDDDILLADLKVKDVRFDRPLIARGSSSPFTLHSSI